MDAKVDMAWLVNDTFVVANQIVIKAHSTKSQHGVPSANGEPRHGSMEILIVGDVQLLHIHQESLLIMNVDGHPNHASQVDGMDDNVAV